jgi:hypothetical protein
MDADGAGDEFTIEEAIEVQLCGIDAVIETVGSDDCPPLFHQVRQGLSSLLAKVRQKVIQPEHAEAQADELEELLDQWRRDNPIPPD